MQVVFAAGSWATRLGFKFPVSTPRTNFIYVVFDGLELDSD